eukprot:scaffold3964_cov77-Skeletonema_marinoi.AAC.2
MSAKSQPGAKFAKCGAIRTAMETTLTLCIPFRCDDIGGDAYEGYIAYVFDHRLLTPVFYGAGQAPQIVVRKV